MLFSKTPGLIVEPIANVGDTCVRYKVFSCFDVMIVIFTVCGIIVCIFLVLVVFWTFVLLFLPNSFFFFLVYFLYVRVAPQSSS